MIDALASVNNFPISLLDRKGRRGPLTSIQEDEDMILAEIAGAMVELPASLSGQLQELMGQRIVVGRFGDVYRVGRCSA